MERINCAIGALMSISCAGKRFICFSLFATVLSGCFHPPYNRFQDDHQGTTSIIGSAALGAGAGAVIGSAAGNTAIGAIVGGVAGTALGAYQTSKPTLIRALLREDIQLISYGDTMTLIVPTDNYFLFNSPRLNDINYKGLNDIVKLIKYYPHSPIYVAAFTDDVGSKHHKKMLSQGRAETMLTFLWAHGIPAEQLRAEGYADQHTVGDNRWIRGSAYNRRIEIQWLNVTSTCCTPKSPSRFPTT